MKLLAVACLAACSEVPIFQGGDFTSDPPAPPPLDGHVVTIDFGDDTLTALAPAPTADFAVPIGVDPVELEGPRGLAVAASGAIYFVLSEANPAAGGGAFGPAGDGTQPGHVVRFRDGFIDGDALVEPAASAVALSPDGATLYAAHDDVAKWQAGAAVGDLRQGDSDIAIIDEATMHVTHRLPVCPAIAAIALAADGKTLFAACGPDELGVVDLSHNPPAVARVPLPGLTEGATCVSCPGGIGVATDGKIWIGEAGGADVYDPGGHTFGARIALCGSAGSPAFRVATAIFPTAGCASGDGIELVPGGIVTGPGCLGGRSVAVAPSGDAYLACDGDLVVRVDPSTLSVIGTAPTGNDPRAIGWIP